MRLTQNKHLLKFLQLPNYNMTYNNSLTLGKMLDNQRKHIWIEIEARN